MGLLFTTWNISGCHSFGPISVYSSLYQLLIWLHKTPSKRRQESIISRELCKRSLSFHNLETTGSPLTLYLSTVLLWSSSTERGLLNNSCWGFTQQLCSITVLGMIQGGTECISSTHTQARRQMNISQRPEGRSFTDLQKPLPKVAHIKMFFPMGKVCLWLGRC